MQLRAFPLPFCSLSFAWNSWIFPVTTEIVFQCLSLWFHAVVLLLLCSWPHTCKPRYHYSGGLPWDMTATSIRHLHKNIYTPFNTGSIINQTKQYHQRHLSCQRLMHWRQHWEEDAPLGTPLLLFAADNSFPSLPFPSLPFPSLPFPSLPFPPLPSPSLPFPHFHFSPKVVLKYVYVISYEPCR